MLISVCVPVFNGGKYLFETLNSIIQQTYYDIEIIVSDNASTDRSVEIVEKLAKQDKRIRSLRSEKNRGYCKNIEKGIDESSGDIVCVFHADDIYEPDIVAKEYSVMQQDESIEAVFVRSDSFSETLDRRTSFAVYDDLRKTSIYSPDHKAYIGGINEIGPLLLQKGNFFACPSMMARKEAYLKIGGYRETYTSNEDLDLWIRYLRAGAKLAIVDECLLHYRISDSHASAFWAKKLALPIEFRVLEEQLLPDFPVDSQVLGDYKKRKARVLVDRAVIASKAGKRKAVISLLGLSRNEYCFSLREKMGLLQLSADIDLLYYRLLIPLIHFLKGGSAGSRKGYSAKPETCPSFEGRILDLNDRGKDAG
jgi:glycosyltransferase involved in cell wall biosynthesis